MGTPSIERLLLPDAELHYIQPALLNAGWSLEQIRYRQHFAPGRIVKKESGGPGFQITGEKCPAFTLFFEPELPLAIINFVQLHESLLAALDNALPLADVRRGGLDVIRVYATNGMQLLEHDLSTGHERLINLEEFPGPEELWRAFLKNRSLSQKKGRKLFPSYRTRNTHEVKYFENIAINRNLEAILTGKKRMSLGIGPEWSKGFVSAKLVGHLLGEGIASRILYFSQTDAFLCGEPIEQFGPFKNAITNLHRISLWHSHISCLVLDLSMPGSDEHRRLFRHFSPNFFDLVVIDEYHRGSTEMDTGWQEVLGYFKSAIHIGLSVKASSTNVHFFDEKLYEYPMNQFLTDGFMGYEAMRR